MFAQTGARTRLSVKSSSVRTESSTEGVSARCNSVIFIPDNSKYFSTHWVQDPFMDYVILPKFCT